MKAPRFWRLRAWWARRKERTIVSILFLLPDRVKDRVLVHRIGELSVMRPALANVDVPAINVEQLITAMSEENVT